MKLLLHILAIPLAGTLISLYFPAVFSFRSERLTELNDHHWGDVIVDLRRLRAK